MGHQRFFRNTGAPHWRGSSFPVLRNGEWIDSRSAMKGDIFAATEDEQIRIPHKLEEVDGRALPATPLYREAGPSAPPAPSPYADAEAKAEEEGDPAEALDPSDPLDPSPYETSRGWYTMPGGVRLHGKAKAVAFLKEMHGGDA